MNPIYYNLMENPELPKCTKNEGFHTWVAIKKPQDNKSGWHEDKCLDCGIIIGYCTSD